jgi:hypothetical protein
MKWQKLFKAMSRQFQYETVNTDSVSCEGVVKQEVPGITNLPTFPT